MTTKITLHLPAELVDALRAKSKQTGIPQTRIVRDALIGALADSRHPDLRSAEPGPAPAGPLLPRLDPSLAAERLERFKK